MHLSSEPPPGGGRAGRRPERLAVLLSSDVERLALLRRRSDGFRVWPIDSVLQLYDRNLARFDCAIVGTDFLVVAHNDLLLRLANSGLRVLIRVEPNVEAVRDLGQIAQSLRYFQVLMAALTDGEDIIRQADRLLTLSYPGPLGRVLAELPDSFGADRTLALVAATSVAAHSGDLRLLPRLFGIAPRTLNTRFTQLRVTNPYRVLNWARLVWAAWRIGHLGLSPKISAARGGFPSRDAMSLCFHRLTDERVSTLRDPRALSRIVALCAINLPLSNPRRFDADVL